eukprot:gene29667-5082_t
MSVSASAALMRSALLQSICRLHGSKMIMASPLPLAIAAASSLMGQRQAATWSASPSAEPPMSTFAAGLAMVESLMVEYALPVSPLSLARNLRKEPEPFEAEFDEDENEDGEFEDFELWEDCIIDDAEELEGEDGEMEEIEEKSPKKK